MSLINNEIIISNKYNNEDTCLLTGNGELCCTVNPTGYHSSPKSKLANMTQHFVWAGRRETTSAYYPLVNFGSICRKVFIDKKASNYIDWEQKLDLNSGHIKSICNHIFLIEKTTSFISITENVFIAETVIENVDKFPHEISFSINYFWNQKNIKHSCFMEDRNVWFEYENGFNPGKIALRAECQLSSGNTQILENNNGAQINFDITLKENETAKIIVWLHFSDRQHYSYPLNMKEILTMIDSNACEWERFSNESLITTGNQAVDIFRKVCLYTIRCQSTPWSVPASLSKPHWEGGYFHDEMYAFLGLISSGHVELAKKIPYFRLNTLNKAIDRSYQKGAKYPWCSTESGDERDVNGPWLTERFHMGLFAIEIYSLWEYLRDNTILQDFYPLLKELARYYELNVIERDLKGKLQTSIGLDFDETTNPVNNGIFTISAAIVCLKYVAFAATELGLSNEQTKKWGNLADELSKNIPLNYEEDHYTTGGSNPTHIAMLAPIFPFRIDVNTSTAKNTVDLIHMQCKSTIGWKPGVANEYDGQNWTWSAGNLAVAHVYLGESDKVWDVIVGGALSSGNSMVSNEHLNKNNVAQIPWFTTGAGAWVYALNSMFLYVNKQGTFLFSAVPTNLEKIKIENLIASDGVRISAQIEYGKVINLNAFSKKEINWSYCIKKNVIESAKLKGLLKSNEDDWNHVEITLRADVNINLLY